MSGILPCQEYDLRQDPTTGQPGNFIHYLGAHSSDDGASGWFSSSKAGAVFLLLK